MMTDTVINTNTLPEFLLGKIPTEKVLVKVIDGVIRIIPVKDDAVIAEVPTKRQISELRGILKGKVWMSDDFDTPLEEMKEYME
jgi:hypothetical protein